MLHEGLILVAVSVASLVAHVVKDHYLYRQDESFCNGTEIIFSLCYESFPKLRHNDFKLFLIRLLKLVLIIEKQGYVFSNSATSP